MTDSPSNRPPSAARKPFDPGPGLQFVLLLEIGVRLMIWTSALAATLWIAGRWQLWPAASWATLSAFGVAWSLAQRVGHLVIAFNVIYLLIILALRLLIPRPKAGRYALTAGRPDPNMLYTCLLAILTKARYEPPFPAIFVAQLANIQPFRFLFNLQFGPRSKTTFFVEPRLLDPHGVTIGRNVTLGFNTTVAAHLQERDSLTIAPTVIEDDVLVGGYAVIAGGVHIKRGAVVGACSFLKPGTVVGENEFWGGVPAKKIADLPPFSVPDALSEP
jgi:acetyltransferase-like isoleucine patch superfamily enzyme